MKVSIGKWNSAIMDQERKARRRQIKTRKKTVKKIKKQNPDQEKHAEIQLNI
jgi:hypothetical protein